MNIFGNKSGGKHISSTNKFDENKLKKREYHLSKSSVKHVSANRRKYSENDFNLHDSKRTPSSTISDLQPHSYGASDANTNSKRRRSSKNKKSKLSKALTVMLCIVIIVVSCVYIGSKMLISPPKIVVPNVITSPTNENGEVISVPGDDDKNETYIEVNSAEGFTRKDGYYTILVACTDEDKTRTDSIVLCSFDSVNDKINVINIPRDTMSNVSRNLRKINSSYSVGKVTQLKKEVNMLLGIPVDRYVIFDFDAIAEVVDALGGITFNVPVKMNYDDPTQNLHIHFNKGEQLLDGQDVVKVLRFRKNNNGSGYANADIGRIETLQNFAKTLAAKLTSSPSVISKVPAIAQAALKNTTTDLSVSDVGWFVAEGLGMSADSIELFTLPGYNKTVYEPSLGLNQSYWIPKASEIIKLVNESFNPYEEDISKLNVVSSSNISRGSAPASATNGTSSETKKDDKTTSATSKPTSSSDVPVIASSSKISTSTLPSEAETQPDTTEGTIFATTGGDTFKNSRESENLTENTDVETTEGTIPSTTEPTNTQPANSENVTEPQTSEEPMPTESESQSPVI